MSQSVLWGPLILFALVMSLTPGPNVIMVTASAANFGFRRTVPQMVGVVVGFSALVMAVGLGLAGLFKAEPRLHVALRYIGAAYLLYLAWRIATAEGHGHAATRASPIGFVGATLLQWVNPKGWVFAIGALATYATVGGDTLRETSQIAGVLAANTLLSVLVWGGFGVVIGRFLSHPRARMAFNWTMAALLVLSLIPVLR